MGEGKEVPEKEKNKEQKEIKLRNEGTGIYLGFYSLLSRIINMKRIKE